MPVEGKPIRLMTAHEFWLVCERSVLWKNGKETCHEPACIECSLRSGRPPQWWRKLEGWRGHLDRLDLLLTPSESSAYIHAKRGLRRPMRVLPYFLGEDWLSEEPRKTGKDYFLFAGRLVREKGLAQAIEAMRLFPLAELWIAGSGPEEQTLRANAADNVRFLGRLSEAELREVYRGAIATLIPSEMVETFGYVALESMAVGTPVIAHDLGALPELVAQSGGGIVYTGVQQLREAMRQLLQDTELRARLGASGKNAALRLWNEERHIERYLGLLAAVN
jgi:glycosyltransferase involved in cell wall biosynthesis